MNNFFFRVFDLLFVTFCLILTNKNELDVDFLAQEAKQRKLVVKSEELKLQDFGFLLSMQLKENSVLRRQLIRGKP